jgi:hypothetical protein
MLNLAPQSANFLAPNLSSDLKAQNLLGVRLADQLDYVSKDGTRTTAAQMLEAVTEVSTAELLEAIFDLDLKKVEEILAKKDGVDLNFRDARKLEFFRHSLVEAGDKKGLKIYDEIEASILEDKFTPDPILQKYVEMLQSAEGDVMSLSKFVKNSVLNEHYKKNLGQLMNLFFDRDDTEAALLRDATRVVLKKLLRDKTLNSPRMLSEEFNKLFQVNDLGPVEKSAIKDVIKEFREESKVNQENLDFALEVFQDGIKDASERAQIRAYKIRRESGMQNEHGLRTLRNEASQDSKKLTALSESLKKSLIA